MKNTRLVFLSLFSMSVGVSAFVACSGDSGDVAPPAPDAATSETGGDPPKPPPTSDGGSGADGSSDAGVDGDLIDDGGSNIDPDASDDGGLDDAGPDGGACNKTTNAAAPVQSTCSSLKPRFGGGALVAGTYHLTAVAALGAPAFCQNQFNSVKIQQTLEVTVNAGIATIQSVAVAGVARERHTTSMLTPGANNTSPGAIAATCPLAGASSPVPYTSNVRGGTQQLILQLPYGNGEGLYRYDKQ